MDSGRCFIYSDGNVVYIVPENDGNSDENWGLGSMDQAIWATEEDYGVWNTDASVDADSNFVGRQIQTGSGSEPPNKKSRISQLGDVQPTNRSKVMAKMFFRTKLCNKFRDGICPYITNCNFAHSMEELRRLPPNWKELIASYKEEQTATELREEFQIPSQSSFRVRQCKQFLSKEGCPSGDNCSLVHNDQARYRESVVISLGTGKSVHWKTKICNTWEQTGHCSYGNKCNYAHGTAELQYGEREGKEFSSPLDTKQGMVSSKLPGNTVVASAPSVPLADSYHKRVPPQRVPKVQMAEQKSHKKWKGPDKISLIYGDWFDDLV